MGRTDGRVFIQIDVAPDSDVSSLDFAEHARMRVVYSMDSADERVEMIAWEQFSLELAMIHRW